MLSITKLYQDVYIWALLGMFPQTKKVGKKKKKNGLKQ